VASAKKTFTEQRRLRAGAQHIGEIAEAGNHPDANACGSGPARRTDQLSRARAFNPRIVGPGRAAPPPLRGFARQLAQPYFSAAHLALGLWLVALAFLLGINAHVNYDLPQAMLSVIGMREFADPELIASRRRDHERIDGVLAGRVAAEDNELASRSARSLSRIRPEWPA